MKTFLIAAATTLTLAGAASAMTDPSAALQAEVDARVQGVELGALTDAQVNAIKSAVHSGDSAAEVRSTIYSIVNG